MKELKIRGYSVEEDEWYYGHGWFEIDYTEEFKEVANIGDRACLYTNSGPVECDLLSVGEFTGLRDKNKKEIFEGSVVKVPCSINKEIHGNYTLNEVNKINGQWILSYLKSETGKVLPKGSSRGLLLDQFEYSPDLFFRYEDYNPHTDLEIVGDVYFNR